MLPRAFAAGLLVVAVAATGQSQAQSDQLRTRAEITNYEETSSYADVERVASALAANPLVHLESFGRSEQGRDLPLLVISQPRVKTPAEARRLGRPLVFVQANIHGGEVEGKEASLMLARRLVEGDLQPLTKQLVILLAPIYNADGNERRLGLNRTEQNGPIGSVGTRQNARGLDLNRDYMKLESAEARALVGLLNAWDPHVVADLHTTNGSYHGYHLTFAPTLTPNADAHLASFTRETLLPGVRKALLDEHAFRSHFYGNFVPESGGSRDTARVDPASPGDTVWRTFDHRPRFGNNYVGLRNRIAVLSEAYSYLDFQARVAVTSAFTEELLRACARQAARILALTAQADRTFAVRTRQAKPMELGLEFRIQPNAELSTILVGDVTTRPNPRTGAEMRQMTDLAAPVRMKEYGSFVATRTRSLPAGWVIPRGLAASPRMASALDRLRWHGIEIETLDAPAQMDVDRFVIQSLSRSEGDSQGHHEARLAVSMEHAALTVDPGTVLIRASQPLARLAFYLLEPDSDDGLVTWNVIEDGLTVGQGYPVYRVR